MSTSNNKARLAVRIVAGLVALSALSALSAPAFAQASASASTSASATIIQPITLTKNTDLTFGTIVKPTTTSTTVTIDATTGARTFSGGNGVAAGSATSGRATYTVGGEGGQTFSIAVPATFNITSGGNTLVVTPVASAATGTLSGTIGSAGSATFGVGGSFPVATTTVSALYSGTFNVTVAYN